MSTKFTQETKESVQKLSVNRAHLVNEGNLDGTSVNRAHLITKESLKICSINQAHLVNVGKSFLS